MFLSFLVAIGVIPWISRGTSIHRSAKQLSALPAHNFHDELGHLPDSLHELVSQYVLNSVREKRTLEQLSHVTEAKTIKFDESWPLHWLIEFGPIRRAACLIINGVMIHVDKRMVMARCTPPDLLREGEYEIYPSLSRDHDNNRTNDMQAGSPPTHTYRVLCLAHFGSKSF